MKEKTVTVSFRIGERAFDALREDSKRNNISINTLANQIFMSYAEYDRFLRKFSMVKLSAPTFKRVISAAHREEVEEAGAKSGASIPQSFMMAKMGEISRATAVQYLRLMGAYGNLFDYSEVSGTGRSSITLSHDLGPNGSAFLASYVKSIFESVNSEPKIIQFENGITIELGSIEARGLP